MAVMEEDVDDNSPVAVENDIKEIKEEDIPK